MSELNGIPDTFVDDDGNLRDWKTGKVLAVAPRVCARRCVSASLYVASIIAGVVAGFLFARVCNALAWTLGGLL